MSDIERMSAAEIRRNYNEAKDKPYQITILADMNCCDHSAIKKIINGETDELPPLENKRKGYRFTHCADNVKKEIVNLHKQGVPGKEIARRVSRSAATVSTTIKAYKEGKMVFAEEQTAEEREQLTLENIITVVYKLCTANLHNRHIKLSKGDTEQ